MRALLLGAGGMLAQDIVTTSPPDVEVISRRHSELDVTDEAAVTAAINSTRPDVIINCAAYTKVDAAESDRERAWAVNAEAPRLVGRAATRFTFHASRFTPLVVHFSTDYVFNGRSTRPYREEDLPDPLGSYGASKLAGEQALLAIGARCLIIRTSWLFGYHGTSFPRTMRQRARDGKATRVVNDQVGRPTYTVDLAWATWFIIGRRTTDHGPRSDVFNIANRGQTTWYDVARRIFEAAGMPDLLSPCTTAEYPMPAPRPAYSVLDTSKYDALAGAPLPRWEDALDRFLAELSDG